MSDFFRPTPVEWVTINASDAERYRRIEETAKVVVWMWNQGFYLPSDFTEPKMDALRDALRQDSDTGATPSETIN